MEIYDINKRKKIKTLSVPDITDFAGETIKTKIFSIDVFGNNILIVSQGKGGYRDVYFFDKGKRIKIIDALSSKMMIKKAYFSDKNKIILGLLSNELVLYDIIKNKETYRIHLSTSVFSNFVTDKTRSLVFATEESGKVRMLGLKNGAVYAEYSGQNLDNVYSLDYQNGTIITAGQDRKVGIYKIKTGTAYHIPASFLVYCVALNSDASLGAYSANEENDIFIFDVRTKQIKYKLKGQKSTQTKIFFINNNRLISSSEDSEIMFWKI